jgi:hypothetical protein
MRDIEEGGVPIGNLDLPIIAKRFLSCIESF